MANEIFLDNNEKFHVFSKSPITPSMGLSQAVNKSGHTTTTSDVWSQDIPWFFSADDQATALTTGKDAKLNDLVLIGSNVFKRNKTVYSDSATFTDLWESLTLEDGTELYNSDEKHVLTYHKGVSVTFLTTVNNAKQASNYAGRVFKSDGSVIEQFVASTDKVSSGVPSTGYGVAVYKSGSPLSEGEAESNFIANSYAGIIQFNAKVGPSTDYTADVFEYVGEKLNTSITELAKKVDSVTTTAGEGVQTTTAAAKEAGLDVSTVTITPEGQTDPVSVKALDIAVANVSDKGVVASDADKKKLVTATSAQYIATKAASDEIAAATLADGEKIATTADTSKLVTVEDVTTYVSENAKVTLTQGTGITVTPNGQASTSFTVAVDDTVATKQSVDDLSGLVSGLPATIQAAQETADDAKGIAETAIQTVKVNGTALTKSDTEVDITAIVGVDATVANGINVTKTSDNKVKIGVTPATYTSSNKTWTNESNVAKASDVKAAISDAVRDITIPTLSTSSTGVGLSASGHTVNVATADYISASASWTNQGYLVTGATVEAFVDAETTKTLDAAKAYSDSLHTTSLDYVVLGDSESLPPASADTLGKIYLVASQNAPTADGAAISGSYVEYMTRKVSDTQYTWEKIGTTAADLSGYAKSVKINTTTYTASAANAGVLDLGNVVTAVGWNNDQSKGYDPDNEGSIQAYLGLGGNLYLGIASATRDKMGVSKMFTDNLSTAVSNVTDTAVSVKSAQAMYSSLANSGVKSINNCEGNLTFCVHNGVSSNISDGEGEGYDTSTHANLWGTGVHTSHSSSGSIVIMDSFVGLPWNGDAEAYLSLAALPSDAVTVENNFVMNADGKIITTIRPERMYSGFQANSARGLKSFVGDLPNLTTGDVNATRTFYECTALELFIGDLSSLSYGTWMFGNCSALTSFCGDLSSLTDGSTMFSGCSALTSFTSDLSSLTDGSSMFAYCKLDAESVECILESIPTYTSGTYDLGLGIHVDAVATFNEITGAQLPATKGERSSVSYKGWMIRVVVSNND